MYISDVYWKWTKQNTRHESVLNRSESCHAIWSDVPNKNAKIKSRGWKKYFGISLTRKFGPQWICLAWFKMGVITIQMNLKNVYVDHWIMNSSSQFQLKTPQRLLYALTPTRWLWRLSPLRPARRSSPAAPGAETQGGFYRQHGCKGWSTGRAAGDVPICSTPLEPTPAEEPTTRSPPPAEPHRKRRSAGPSNKPRYHGAEPGCEDGRKCDLMFIWINGNSPS